MLFLAQPFWISLLSWSLESAVLVLSSWLSVRSSQLGQLHARLCVPALEAGKGCPPDQLTTLPCEEAAAPAGTSGGPTLCLE